MYKSKLTKVIVSLLRRVLGVTRSGAKRLMRAMLRSLMAMGRRARLPVAGFVLPTVTMVLLVVILLTVAITLRSFDRANTARNVRVNQQVLAAATPALDRARAKIEYMLREDPQRPTATPSDTELYRIMSAYPPTPTPANPDFYTFGDEARLRLRFPLNNGSTLVNANNPQAPLVNAAGQENEAINTAWRYAVDTNNDGKFDTFTLYGIFFRNPPIATAANANAAIGDFRRARQPLDARTPPMSLGGAANQACVQGTDTVASLVGESGWYRVDGRLQKSFFVYTVNVPITQADITANTLGTDFQAFAGTSSISALEYQQDQSRIPLSNNAVVYEDDLDISPGPPLNLNGRVFTNSNLLASPLSVARNIRLFQVSSKSSCFYDRENSKVVVGGNVVNGSADNLANGPLAVEVHLFKSTDDTAQPDASPPAIETGNQSVGGGNSSFDILYNSEAYTRRLDALVESQMLAAPTTDPVSVQRAQLPPLSQQRDDALESYFKERLRKVPFAEAPLGSTGGVDVPITPAPNTYVLGSGDTLRPRDNWSLPTGGSATVGTANGPTGLNLALAQPPATKPELITSAGSEQVLGDRLDIGNNLPAQRWDGSKFLGSATQDVDSGTQWTTGGGQRTRTPQVTKLAEVGATDRGNGLGEAPTAGNPFRDGFWEKAAAQIPTSPLEGTGGLRVITSAGVYDRTNSFLPPPRWINAATGTWETGPANTSVAFTASNTYDDPATPAAEQYRVVWPDSMPMSPLGPGSQVYDNTDVTAPNWIDFSATDPAEASTTLLPGIVEANARKYAKGDLRMRASAVYHYADDGFDATALASAPAGTQPDQTPFACVSSYYDPSDASTARNITTGTLPDVSGQGVLAPFAARRNATLGGQQAFIGSNNGVTYGPPTRPRPPGPSALDPATGLLSGGDAVLAAQANLVFPDGRFANGPLRTALQLPETERTLAQKAAIDSTNCAIQILNGTIARAPALIPDGAIQEVAFVNGREVKAVERDNPQTIVNEAFTLSRPLGDPVLSTDYNQPLEEREPLEIRATQLDIDALRGTNIAAPAGTEWLLPNSGIIYASRDDALPDRSDRSLTPAGLINQSRSKRISPSDFRLDPTRKPNGIVLINGQRLFRGGAAPTPSTSVTDIVREKGLTLVSNLPVYIQGTFNPHGRIAVGATNFTEVEEFDQLLTLPNWSNFYQQRTDLDPNFACRQGDPRLPNCGGDFWRPATVLADAVTLLSENYRFGFRNEGDFDLRNNAGAAAVLLRRQQGFFNNNFVTNGLSSAAFLPNGNLAPLNDPTALRDADYVAANPRLTSSYFNNFVTPVQRRGPFPEYVMEACIKLPVSECTDADWFIDPLAPNPAARRKASATIGTAYQPPDPILANVSFQAGSTVDPPVPQLQRFPRRVAFQRDAANGTQLVNPDTTPPVPLGINGAGNIAAGVGRVTAGSNGLWFAAANAAGNVVYTATDLPYLVNGTPPGGNRDGSRVPLPTLDDTAPTVPQPPPVTATPAVAYNYEGSQPLLMPVPQLLHAGPTIPPPPAPVTFQAAGATANAAARGWIPGAANTGTTFNLIIAAGDTPSRALSNASGDFNGGLQNLPRFLELWRGNIPNNIKGSFIQQNRSAFSTAPYLSILPPNFPANAADRLATLFATAPPDTTLAAPAPLPSSVPLTAYSTSVGTGRIPYFSPPSRNWGFDVGLLSQPPDLFTQKFTTPSTKTQPAEYFRQVGRTDEWVETLMCGVLDDGGTVPATSSRPTADCPT